MGKAWDPTRVSEDQESPGKVRAGSGLAPQWLQPRGTRSHTQAVSLGMHRTSANSEAGHLDPEP